MINKGKEVHNKDGDLTVANDTTNQQKNDRGDEIDALIGLQDQDYFSTEDDDDEDYCPMREMSSKRVKRRHTPKQIQELEASYQKCTHPDAKTQQALSSKSGLEILQVKFWFQNRRSQIKMKAHVQENNVLREDNDALLADNFSLQQAMLMQSCFKCGAKPTPTKLPLDKQHLLLENERLNNEFLRASTVLNMLYRVAPPFGRPVSTSLLLVPSLSGGEGERAILLRHAQSAMEQFDMLATKGEPIWIVTTDGEVLTNRVYQETTFPMYLGPRPSDFKVEAIKVTGMVRGSAADIVGILIDSARWSKMFPGIVVGVTSGEVILGSMVAPSDGLIQLMNAELWVQSPRVPNRTMQFLRYSKMKTDKNWVVMDVSVDGLLGQNMRDVNLNNNPPVLATHTECRLLPSGCLIEDMSNDYCKVTWIVHAEYNDTTVPMMFKPLFLSGQGLGACRWLTSLQRQCESLHARDAPVGINTATMSVKGRRSILEMSQRMLGSFYAAVLGPINQRQKDIREWHSGSSGTDTMGIEAVVRMVTWQNATNMPTEPIGLVLSATATFWLPCTTPKCVFDYLCDLKTRGEWDFLINSAKVKELVSITTGHQDFDVVSVLYPDVTYGTNGNMMILQEAYIDESSALVVYSPIDEMSIGAIMNDGDHTSVFLLPSGFAILPDGCSKAHRTRVDAPGSSNTLTDDNNAKGSLLTVAVQTLIPGSQSGNLTTWAFDVVGKVICGTIKKIQTAVKADIVILA